MRTEHEPIQHRARLRHLFRCFDEERQDVALGDAVIGGFVREIVRDAERRPVAIFGNTLSHLAPVLHRLLGDRLRLLHLHRDPVVTTASIFVKSRPEWWTRDRSFEDDPHGLRIAPFDPYARYDEYRERWSSLSLFERILYQWLERHAYGEEAIRRLRVPALSIRSEDLFAGPAATLRAIADLLGLEPIATDVGGARRNASWARNRERRPLGSEWRAYERHPRVIELARRLGHPLERDAIEREMTRYALPPGFGPWIRHRTRYWERRERLVRRFRGPATEPPSDRAGLPPRSLREAVRETLNPRGRT